MRLLLLFFPLYLFSFTLQEKQRIGERIWKNECNGTISGLTSWNVGEPFPLWALPILSGFRPGARAHLRRLSPR